MAVAVAVASSCRRPTSGTAFAFLIIPSGLFTVYSASFVASVRFGNLLVSWLGPPPGDPRSLR